MILVLKLGDEAIAIRDLSSLETDPDRTRATDGGESRVCTGGGVERSDIKDPVIQKMRGKRGRTISLRDVKEVVIFI